MQHYSAHVGSGLRDIFDRSAWRSIAEYIGRWYFSSGSVTLHRLNSANVEAEREMATQTALKQAKEALIAFAAISGNQGASRVRRTSSLLGSQRGSQLSSYCTARDRPLAVANPEAGPNCRAAASLMVRAITRFSQRPNQHEHNGSLLTIDAQPTGYAIVFSAGQPRFPVRLRSAVSSSPW